MGCKEACTYATTVGMLNMKSSVKRMCKNVPSEPSASMCWHRDQLITANLVLERCLNFTTLKFLTVHGISSIENSTSMKLQL